MNQVSFSRPPLATSYADEIYSSVIEPLLFSHMELSRTPGSILFVASETSFQLFSRRDLHLPRVLRPNKLMGLVKGEGRRGCCLHVKVAVGFKVLLIKFSSGNHRLLGVLCKEQSGTGIQETSLQQCNSGT